MWVWCLLVNCRGRMLILDYKRSTKETGGR
jgi:hypothetical protein